MNILDVMTSLNFTSALKTKLLKMGIPEKEMEGVDFNSMDSLNKFAERVVPNMIKKNPKMKEMIKGCSWLEGKTKEQVNTVIEGL